MSVALERLRRQFLIAPSQLNVASLVARFGAVQAQEFGPAKWGLAMRMREGTADATIDSAFATGRILRTHVMRPTWHFVAADDIRWLLDLTAPRVQRIAASYNRRLELDTPLLNRAIATFERALSGGRALTRAELGDELARNGVEVKGQRLSHVMMHGELEGAICSGPRRGKQFTYALLAERAPSARTMTREAALAELSRRYFTTHGPATIRDFVWWSGLTTADAKRGLEINGAKRLESNGLTYWTIGRAPARPSVARHVHLLPIYDEYLVAYRDRAAVPYTTPTPNAERAGYMHSIVIDGQIAGSWKSVGGSIKTALARRLTVDERASLDLAAARYRWFTNT